LFLGIFLLSGTLPDENIRYHRLLQQRSNA